jgi:MFS family permease
MMVVAVGWQLYEMTGSAFDLGLLGLAQFLPILLLTLFVGHVADRYDHRFILMLCQLTSGAPRPSSRSARRWAG